MDYSRTLLFLSLSWSFLVLSTYQLQPSQTQVLLQLRKQLEFPKQLDYWHNHHGVDLCSLASPQVSITCQNDSVTEIRIFGSNQTLEARFKGYFSPDATLLSQNFSLDSLVATLSRISTLRALSLVSLGIWGPIPDKIHRLQSLVYLDLSWNSLSGSIPHTLARIGKLQTLKLDGNFLEGSVPDWFNSISNLTTLSLSSNRLDGQLPFSLQRITSLTEINLSNNGISGLLLNFSSLARLRLLDLSNNRLNSDLVSMPKGVLTVVLSNNSFSGTIPHQYGQLYQLQRLDLSFNALKGTASAALFALPNITSLNLASNLLTGSLSAHLSCGGKLGFVDISNNRLTGSLPSCLSSSDKNIAVMLGGNCLLADLAQQKPETQCAEKPKEENFQRKHVKMLAAIIGGTIVLLLLLAFGFFLFFRQYCPRGSSEQHLPQKSVQENTSTNVTMQVVKPGSQGKLPHQVFTLDELEASTDNFNNSYLIGENSTGKMYKGRLENGSNIAIRCLTVSKRHRIRNLKLRLDLLSKLRHPHLVCLLGHCIDSEGKHEFGAHKVHLIYEFLSNGNYHDCLCETSEERALKWPDRLAILTGIAKAVHFLHTGIIPGFFGNRLKSNNVLINKHGVAKLSDYGLSVIAQDINIDKQEDGLQSWQDTSLNDDIYSFGLILQESIVGPSVCTGKAYSGIPNDKIDRIVLQSSSQESLSKIISLTINCISPESTSRPTFEDIVWGLQQAAQIQATSVIG